MTEAVERPDRSEPWDILAALVYEIGPVLPVSQATLELAMRGELRLDYTSDNGTLILKASTA